VGLADPPNRSYLLLGACCEMGLVKARRAVVDVSDNRGDAMSVFEMCLLEAVMILATVALAIYLIDALKSRR
jgi:hypothetical protein